MTRILVVDDHAIVRAGVRRLLVSLADVQIEEADSGEAALAMAGRMPFHLVVLDLNLPGIGGPELLRRLLQAAPDLAVLVFSMRADPIHLERALQAGARGYVSKNAPADELLTAVKAILAGGIYVERELAAERGVEAAELYLRPLTNRDLEIMRLLAQGRSLTEIAGTLGVAYKTVANTCGLIKEKLGVANTADLIRISLERGLA
jgi:two-component system, NarL family, invasion response regulator UvrY